MKTKTIDIIAKEWFDRIGGNTYFSVRIILNYAMKDEKTLYLPMEYGRDDQYRYTAFDYLKERGYITDVKEVEVYWQYFRRKGIIPRYVKYEKCKKREVNEWGENPNKPKPILLSKREVKKMIGKKVDFLFYPMKDKKLRGSGIIAGYVMSGVAIVKVLTPEDSGWEITKERESALCNVKIEIPTKKDDRFWFIGRQSILKIYEE